VKKMKVLELFSGTASFSQVARARGHECVTLDNDSRFNPDICKDIMEFELADLKGFEPDVVWASPPCEAFSVNTIGRNWIAGQYPKSEKAEKALLVIERTIAIIELLAPRFYIIENPRAMLRNQMMMLRFPRKTVTYCQYGELRMKPTDLWTNIPFEARSCKYGDPCHPRTPRGHYSGKSYQQLAKVPRRLCEEIIMACEAHISDKEVNPNDKTTSISWENVGRAERRSLSPSLHQGKPKATQGLLQAVMF